MASEFYVRYYVGHKGKFGHEFLEFEFRPDGKLEGWGSKEVGGRILGVWLTGRSITIITVQSTE